MHSRYAYLSLGLIAVAASAGFVYALPVIFPSYTSQHTNQNLGTIIHIPPGSSSEPSGWVSYQNLSSPNFHFKVNPTVIVGVNNTIEWINDDDVAHTVTSFQVPSGASTFNSDLIFPGKTFTVTLATPGVYKYFCAWHNWLGGVITVKSA